MGPVLPHPAPRRWSHSTKKLGPEGVHALHDVLAQQAQRRHLIRKRRQRQDTTVVESDIHYFTDSRLLEDGVRSVARTGRPPSGGAAGARRHHASAGPGGQRRGPDGPADVKGKVSKPVELDDKGETPVGNRPDIRLLAPALVRHRRLCRRAPRNGDAAPGLYILALAADGASIGLYEWGVRR